MSVFVMADLHLCTDDASKSMEVFGNRWKDYQNRIAIDPIITIIDFAKKQDKSLEYTIKNKKIYVAIYDEEEIEEIDPLEILKPITEYNKISFPIFVECTNENIDKLIHLIYNYNSNESHNGKEKLYNY